MAADLKKYMDPEYYLAIEWEPSPRKMNKKMSMSSIESADMFRSHESFEWYYIMINIPNPVEKLQAELAQSK